jgi:uncharacterized protein with NRDE domain
VSISRELSNTKSLTTISILATNRDEYLDRPTLPASWHTFEPLQLAGNVQVDSATNDSATRDPWVLSGRDMGSPAGGTWLGMTKDLRVAVL